MILAMTGWLVGLLYVTVVGAGLLVWAVTRQGHREAEKALQTALEARQDPPPPVIVPPPDVTPLLKELLEGVALIVQGPPGPSPSGVTGAPGPLPPEPEDLGEPFIPTWEVDDTWLPEDTSEMEGEWSAHTQPFPGGAFEMSPEGERFMFGNGGLRLPDLD